MAEIFRVTVDAEGDNPVTLDATVSEEHAEAVTLTKHPVEEGAAVTDHARKEPDRFTLSGAVVSNAPIGIGDEAVTRARARAEGEPGFAESAHETLRALLAARRAVVVKTNVRTYRNVVMVGLATTADRTTGGARRMSLTFEEVRFVRSERVRLELLTAPTRVPTKPTKKVDKGKQAPQSVDETKRRSTAKTATDAASWTTPGGGVDR